MTRLSVLEGGGKYHAAKKQKDQEQVFVKHHCKVSIEDVDWVRSQHPSVQQLWLDCISAEQFGGSAHILQTKLTYKSLRKAKAVLEEKGLFKFKEEYGKLPSGRSGLVGYKVSNLHGYYNKKYWEESQPEMESIPIDVEVSLLEVESTASDSEQIQVEMESFQINSSQTQSLQGFQNPNNANNYSSTTSQPPTKVVEEGVSESRPPAIAPLGGASPANESEPIDNLIAQNMSLRPEREHKLKAYVLAGKTPPKEFLDECWQDPILKLKFKKQGWANA